MGSLSQYDAKRWFTFPIAFLSFLTGKEALVLSSIISIISDTAHGRDEDWHRVSNKQISNAMRGWLSPRRIREIVADLKTLKLVETVVTLYNVRYIRVLVNHVDELVLNSRQEASQLLRCSHPAESASSKHPTTSTEFTFACPGDPDAPTRTHASSAHTHVSTHTRSPPFGGLSLCEKEKEPKPKINPSAEYLPLANKLKKAISKVHLVPKHVSLIRWAGAFRKLHTVDGFSVDLIEEILSWYCKEFPKEDPYLPIAESGVSFRQKFSRIEAAMRRKTGTRRKNARKDKKAKKARAVAPTITNEEWERFENDDID